MPPIIKRPQKEEYGKWWYRCPKCRAIHYWQANKCHKSGCKYVGELTRQKRGVK